MPQITDLIHPISSAVPAEKRWKVVVDGVSIDPDFVSITNEAMGLTACYGQPQGAAYAQIAIGKPGGVIVIAYCDHPIGDLVVSVVNQPRVLMTGTLEPIPNAPRGFRLPQGQFQETAVSETESEIGHGLTSRLRPLHCPAMNADSTLFCYTSGPGGERFFCLEVQAEELELVDAHDENCETWQFCSNVVSLPHSDDEKIRDCRFVPIGELINQPCGFTRMAAYELIRYLKKGELLNTL